MKDPESPDKTLPKPSSSNTLLAQELAEAESESDDEMEESQATPTPAELVRIRGPPSASEDASLQSHKRSRPNSSRSGPLAGLIKSIQELASALEKRNEDADRSAKSHSEAVAWMEEAYRDDDETFVELVELLCEGVNARTFSMLKDDKMRRAWCSIKLRQKRQRHSMP